MSDSQKTPTFKEYLKKITPEQFKGTDIRYIAEEIGVDVALKLIESFSGMISIPQTALDEIKRQYINETYDGERKTILKLSKETGFSIDHIQKMVRGNKDQLSIFDQMDDDLE